MTELPIDGLVQGFELPSEGFVEGFVLHSHIRPGLHIVLQQIDAAWKAAYYVDTRGGTPTIVEIRIVPVNTRFETIDTGDVDGDDVDVDVLSNLAGHEPVGLPERPLSARSLQRRLRPGRAIRVFATVPGYLSDASLAKVGLTREMLAQEPDRHRRGGLPDYFIAAVAKLYVDALNRRSPRPVEDVTKQLNEIRASRHRATYVRDLLVRARKDGLLAPESPGRGKAQGWLTPKGQKALEDAPSEPLA